MFNVGSGRGSFHSSSARFFVAGLLLASACAGGDEGNVADEPIAKVDLDNGMTVSFFEPSPGAILVAQSAPVGVRPLADQGLTAVELYALIAPDQSVPDALAMAQARQDALLEERGVERASIPVARSSVAGTSTASFIDNKSCDDEWFSNNFCSPYNGDWDMCLLNWWNGAYATSSSVDEARYAVCADIGNVTFKVQMGDGNGGIWSVLEGHYVAYHWLSGWLNESTRGDVLDATNDRFHYAAHYWY
jgi:hypothetical protein